VRLAFSSRVLVPTVLCAACAHGNLSSGFVEDADAGPPLVIADPGLDAGTLADAGLPPGCTQSATLVYVIGEGDTLHSFHPPTQTFSLMGKLSCLTKATHMTVDRQGIAWVVAAGVLYRASTGNPSSCAAVSTWTPDLPYADFSLTFIGASKAPDNLLYLMNNTVTLYTFDVATGMRTLVAPVVAVSSTEGDMTTNGDGKLFFLRDAMPHTLYELDPATAAVVGQEDLTANGTGSQALAFWGGLFYAFENDVIFAYDPAKKSTTRLGTAPFKVTGAGQSTCVPKVPPLK
jgi:hypothetical protein